MSYDLDFWKYQDGVYLDNQTVYEKACCDGERVEGLEKLPIGQIRQRIADWQRLDGDNYEKRALALLPCLPHRRLCVLIAMGYLVLT